MNKIFKHSICSLLIALFFVSSITDCFAQAVTDNNICRGAGVIFGFGVQTTTAQSQKAPRNFPVIRCRTWRLANEDMGSVFSR